jgi:hypothetical protein
MRKTFEKTIDKIKNPSIIVSVKGKGTSKQELKKLKEISKKCLTNSRTYDIIRMFPRGTPN